MNKSKLMNVLGTGCLVCGLYSAWVVWSANGQLYNWAGCIALIVTGVAVLNAKHHRH